LGVLGVPAARSIHIDRRGARDAGVFRRLRRTNGELAALDNQIVEVLQECHPQSVRHVYYCMTDTRLAVSVPKTDKGAGSGYGVVQRRLSKMREDGRIPFGWIVDFTRRGYHVVTYDSAADFLRRTASTYRANIWVQAESYVEVWAESRSIAGVVEELCEELAVSLYPAGGFTSHSLVHDCAGNIKNQLRDNTTEKGFAATFKAAIKEGGKPINVIYIGDYDPSGVLIDRDIERRLRRHLGDDGDRLTFHRIAITPEQVEEYGLPKKPRKAKEKRSKEILWTVEAEALPVPILLQLLREKVESFLPPGALLVAKAAEESEKRQLKIFARIATDRDDDDDGGPEDGVDYVP
jgi:hypothetical protein